MAKILRKEQLHAIKLIDDELYIGNNRIILKAGCGFGKTVVALEIIKSAIKKNKRICFCVPLLVLLDQTINLLFSEKIPFGVIQGNHPLRRLSESVQIASLMSLKLHHCEFLDILMIDEAHVQNKIVDKIIKEYPKLVIIGFTATPYSVGMGNIYQKAIEPVTAKEMVQLGRVHDLDVRTPYLPDTSGIKGNRDDFFANAADAVMSKKEIMAGVVENWVSNSNGRPTLVCAGSVGQSQEFVRRFTDLGYTAAHIDAKTPKNIRAENLSDFDSGKITILSSVGVLVLGYDAPIAEIGIIAFISRSVKRHVQAIGRLTRIYTPLKNLCESAILPCVFVIRKNENMAVIVNQASKHLGSRIKDVIIMDVEQAAEYDISFMQAYHDVHRDKVGAIIYDHAGNTYRLGEITHDHGTHLDCGEKADERIRAKRKDALEKVLPKKCSKCDAVLPYNVYVCPNIECQSKYEIQKENTLKEQPGELRRLRDAKKRKISTSPSKASKKRKVSEKAAHKRNLKNIKDLSRSWGDLSKRAAMQKIVAECRIRGYHQGWSAHTFKAIFGHFP